MNKQFMNPTGPITNPLYDLETQPRIPAWPQADDLFPPPPKPPDAARTFSTLEIIAIFFITIGLIFLALTIIVVFYQLFMVILHSPGGPHASTNALRLATRFA